MSYYVEMITVTSSFIRAVGYSEEGTLYVEMRTGETYDLRNCPYYHFEGLLNASSKGRYWNQYLRGRYR